MKYKFLNPDQFPQIHKTFHEAFSDYAVDVRYMTEEVIRNRAIKNGIDFGLSVAAFHQDKMVGFTLVGKDIWQDELSAFDIMTGLCKPYRGKGIAGEMFEFCLPKVRSNGIKNFVLEVLQENEPAIKAYSRSGFEIVRAFNCFHADPADLKIPVSDKMEITIRKLGKTQLKSASEFLDWQPSWENSISSLQRIPDELIIFGAFAKDEMVGILAYYPLIRWLNLLAINKAFRRKGIAGILLKYLIENIDPSINEIKAVNVDASDIAMNFFLQKVGFRQVTSQYEMRLKL
jgi:GNAT superfamily N-acetyltransferase